MKTPSKIIAILATAIGAALIGSQNLPAAETNAPPGRIGVYDSRVVAYADFCSEARQRKIREWTAAAKEAKAAGQTERFNELRKTLQSEQERSHLQVFSTAPVEETLDGMKARVAEVQRTAGVTRLVSKWDSKGLEECGRAEQVDVTDQLLRDFRLTEKQSRVVLDIRKQAPLPLDQARKLARDGKL